MTGLQLQSSQREAVIVAVDANRTKGSMEAIEWALKHVVKPGDIFLVLGVFTTDHHAKNSCFPFKLRMGFGVSGIWKRLESIDHEEVDPAELGEELKRKIGQYQSSLRPLYRQCSKNEVRLVLKFAAGFCPARLTIKESHNLNTRWIVLDSHFKKWKVYLRGHVTCNVAVVKEKDFASLMLSNDTQPAEICPSKPNYYSAASKEHLGEEHSKGFSAYELRNKSAPTPYPQNPCCYPLSWTSGFPRVFSYNELEMITNGFADDNILAVVDGITVHQGILQETPVLVNSLKITNKGFWSVLEILSRVRHRNIVNLVGYCSTGASAFLLFDLPCLGTVGINLQWDELAEKLDWRVRWSIALEIGGSLRYLHEECVDGPIVHKNVHASSVALSHGYSAMLCNFVYAEWLKGDITPTKDLISKYDKLHFGDVHDYGKFLLELITGKCVSPVHDQRKDQSMIEGWKFASMMNDFSQQALRLLENGEFGKLKDCRLTETAGDARMVRNMAHAALRCLKVDSDHKFSISEAIAIVRGDEHPIFNQ
ncbi:proline-rich receptor-like protein kinase PERK14 [Pyrus x bretschneideri]|uniref:proline-rich receptor-like protein kinase PERK14 n=1 Tax=Pyrus x bretschneideri TaxID=225117 RepID=UPI002030F1AF|nr:proline-rich receptor-like protein kinase PERK14 [Pyrus x bretschneideri]